MQYWDHGVRKRESTSTDDQREARKILNRILLELDAMQSAEAVDEPTKLYVCDLFDALERDYLMNRKKSIRNIRGQWSSHLKAVFSQIPASELTADRIETYIVDRQKQGAANATINRELAALKRMYALALKTRKLSLRPYIPQLEERNVRKGFLKDQQYEALARETAAIGLWLRGMFEIGYIYGWRKTELLGLKVGQVDLIERTIDLYPGETKNDDARSVDMTDKVFELLCQLVSGKQPEDLVFTRDHDRSGRKSKIGGRIVDYRDAWTEACEAAGVPELLFHDLRRSGVRNMRRLGISEKVAMRISGHKTHSVFERYNIVDRDDLKEATRKMDAAAQKRRQAGLFEQPEMFSSTPPEPRKAS
jgi:integrase